MGDVICTKEGGWLVLQYRMKHGRGSSIVRTAKVEAGDPVALRDEIVETLERLRSRKGLQGRLRDVRPQ